MKYLSILSKHLAVELVSILILSTNFPIASATVEIGKSCAKEGLTSRYSGKKLICIKKSGKLLWEIQISTSKANVGPVKSNKPISEDKTQNQILPKVQIDPIRISAFQNAHSIVCASTHPNVLSSIEKGPAFSSDTANFVTGILNHDFDCFNSLFSSKLQLKVFYLTENDDGFVNSKVMPSIHPGDVEHLKWLMTEMKAGRWGSQGMAGGFVNRSADGTYITMVIHTTSNYAWTKADAKLVTHEFIHVLQHYFRDNISFEKEGSWYKNIPGYFLEGGADALAFSFEADSIESQDKLMKKNEFDMSRANDADLYRSVASEEKMLQLMKNTIAPNDPVTQNIQYPIGQLISEYILGTFGVDSYLALIKGAGVYSDFDENLKSNLGLNQNDLLQAAASYVYAQWKVALGI